MVKPMEISEQEGENFSAPMPLPLFNFEANKLISQHLSGADFLKLSEVSTTFSAYVNKHQMDKIRILIHETKARKLDVEALLSSNRQYRHIKIKKLVYAHHSAADLFRRFAYTLASIHTAYDFQLERGQLPSVKTLIMVLDEDSNGYLEDGLLSTVSNLEFLQLHGRNAFPMQLVNCLNNNSKLKHLILEKNAQDTFFNNFQFPKFSLQLQSLKLDSSQFEDMAEQNFERFLASMTTLKEIKVLSVESLTFSPPAAYSNPLFCIYDFGLNENITYLGLILVDEKLMTELLPKLPRLTTLYVSDPTPPMFKCVITSSPSLKEFRFAYFREAYFSLELVRAIYQREVTAGNPIVTKGIIITQI